MKKLDWLRDELILALALYFRIRPAAPDPNMPEVKGLSDALQNARFHPPGERPSNFRSPASVVMKLMNFRSIDPEYAGEGLSAGSRRDREIWNEFAADPTKLNSAAKAIQSQL